MMDLSDTIIAKSNQLNAEDLISADRIIKVTSVRKYSEKGVTKFDLSYEGDQGRVYKPSKGMRVVITSGWGMDGDNFIGKYLRLYYDPDAVYAGKEVGGIRINGMSNIKDVMKVRITERRGLKKEYVVQVLNVGQPQPYPEEHFNKVFPVMEKKVLAGEMTQEQVINKCEATGFLSDNQKDLIRAIGKQEEQQPEAPVEPKVESKPIASGGGGDALNDSVAQPSNQNASGGNDLSIDDILDM